MSTLTKLTVVELKLFLRDPAAWIFAVLLPTGFLLVLGAIPALRTPDETFGGERFIDVFAPSLLVITMATLGLNMLPIRLSTYREKGVLRRLSTTPVRPGRLLVAQLVANLLIALAALAVFVAAGALVFDVAIPQQLPGFVAAFLLGLASLFALGLLVAAVAPSARAGTGMALPLFFLAMFFGGVYLPRFMLPELIVRIGDYTPPGVQALLDTWMGRTPDPLPLVVLAVITVAAGLAAARIFRWE